MCYLLKIFYIQVWRKVPDVGSCETCDVVKMIKIPKLGKFYYQNYWFSKTIF